LLLPCDSKVIASSNSQHFVMGCGTQPSHIVFLVLTHNLIQTALL